MMTDDKPDKKTELQDKRPLVVIGTSGSHDYLNDTTGNRRFWPVSVRPAAPDAPLSPEDQAIIDKLIAMSPNVEGACDGIHDEGAPAHYLCTRCFPEGGDLATHEDDVQEDVRQDHDEEME